MTLAFSALPFNSTDLKDQSRDPVLFSSALKILSIISLSLLPFDRVVIIFYIEFTHAFISA